MISVITNKMSFLCTALVVATLSVSPLIPQVALAGEVMEKSKQVEVQEASKGIIQQIRKEANDKTPKPFLSLLKTMESDGEFSLNLTHAIGSKKKEAANMLLTKATEAKMSVNYVETDSGSDIVRFRLCATFNGVRHCFPSQRNSLDCPSF